VGPAAARASDQAGQTGADPLVNTWRRSPFQPALSCSRRAPLTGPAGIICARRYKNKSAGVSVMWPPVCVTRWRWGAVGTWLGNARKDRFTVSIAVLALVVAVCSAIASYKQYRLNSDRDAREQLRDDQARKPIVSVSSQRVGGERRFSVTFTITNRQVAEADLQRVTLLSPNNLALGVPTGANSEGHPFHFQGWVGPPLVLPFTGQPLALGERASLAIYVDAPDEVALKSPTIVKVDISFKLRDNNDTVVHVERSVNIF
jgi:hypothetical protein